MNGGKPMGWPKPPFKLREVKIEVTHDCMLKCVHCSSMAQSSTGRVMDWPTCKRILSEAAAMGVEEVSFSGGEPLLWKKIVNAVELSTSLGMRAFIYTTGIAPNAEGIIDQLKVAGLSRAMFSIFGEDAAAHELITVTSGSYIKTLAAAKYFIDIGVDAEFHFVPLTSTYKALTSIANKARSMGVKRVSVLRLVPQGRGVAIKDTQLSHAQNVELRKIINDLRSEDHDIRVGSPYNFLMLRKKPQCLSGIDRLTVTPDSKIYPCDAFKQISPGRLNICEDYSDLDKNSLQDCWDNSPYLGVIRDYLMTDFADDCSKCKKLKECLSGCMAQKFYKFGNLKKCADPMCMLQKQSSLNSIDGEGHDS